MKNKSHSLLFLLLSSLLAVVTLSSCSAQKTAEGKLSLKELELRQATFANEAYPVRIVNRLKFSSALRPMIVTAPVGYPAGSILVDTSQKFLYLIGETGQAHRYGIGVGATGHVWSGSATIKRKAKWPVWHPTDDMHNQTPGLPRRIEPGPENPLGARALYLYQNGMDTLYRIHGTSEPWTIGTEASSGCIRMINEDVIDLYDRVILGAIVTVI